MNLSKLWDILDVLILIGILIVADVYAFLAGQFWLGVMIAMCGGCLAITELCSKLRTGKTITQNFKKAWRENRKSAIAFILAWLAFSIYLALHLTVLP